MLGLTTATPRTASCANRCDMGSRQSYPDVRSPAERECHKYACKLQDCIERKQREAECAAARKAYFDCVQRHGGTGTRHSPAAKSK